MDKYLFEVTNKIGRKIHLSKERWKHINRRHPSIANYSREIKKTLQNPDTIKNSDIDENIYLYYKYYKYLKSPHKYILLVVKYLNGHGFIISAFFEKNIK